MDNFNDMVGVLEAIVFGLHGLPLLYAAFMKETLVQGSGMDIVPNGILQHKHIRPPIRAKPGRDS